MNYKISSQIYHLIYHLISTISHIIDQSHFANQSTNQLFIKKEEEISQ